MMAGWFGGIVCTKDNPWRRETILSIPMKFCSAGFPPQPVGMTLHRSRRKLSGQTKTTPLVFPYSAKSTLQLKVLRREDQAKLISLQSSVQAI